VNITAHIKNFFYLWRTANASDATTQCPPLRIAAHFCVSPMVARFLRMIERTPAQVR
jgi:hypothetical protein